MRQNDKSRLTHMLESAEEIQQWFSEKSREDFEIDKMMQKAAAKNIEIIGEATKNISEALRTRYREVPWKDMAGARDVLTHEYFQIDLDEVWEMCTQDIPELILSLKKILVQIEDE
ncbi:MAG: DUF86 domain-containing protein [Bacillota bacterium]|nr:DUF86 domain-containing protein [Bacillota bacterium]